MSETTTQTEATEAPNEQNEASAAPEAPTSLSAEEAFQALEKADKAGEEPKEDGEKTDKETTTEGGENAEGDSTSKVEAPEVRDLSDLPETAKIKIGDAEFSVADVKATQQREAALTQRQVKLDAERKKATAYAEANRDSLKQASEAAAARFQSLSENYEEAKRRFPEGSEGRANYERALAEAFDAQNAAKERFESLDKDLTEQRTAEFKKGLEGMAKYLMDPATGIQGYNQTRHDDNSRFAASMGVPKEMLGQLTDGPAWRLIDMARRFSEGQKAAETLRANPATKSATPKLKSQGDNTTGASAKGDKVAKAEKAFKSSGSAADALALLNARS